MGLVHADGETARAIMLAPDEGAKTCEGSSNPIWQVLTNPCPYCPMRQLGAASP